MFAARTLIVSLVVVFAHLGWASDEMMNGTNDTSDFYDFVPVTTETTTTKDMTTTSTMDITTTITEKNDDGNEKTDNKEARTVLKHSVKVIGEVVMTVKGNVTEFVSSAGAKLGVQKAIALKADVDIDRVEVTLSLVESEARRLSILETIGNAKADYTITLPATSSTDAASKAVILQSTMDSISTDELAEAIMEAVSEETGIEYEVEVQQFTATATAMVEDIVPEADDDDAADDDNSNTTAMVEEIVPEADDDDDDDDDAAAADDDDSTSGSSGSDNSTTMEEFEDHGNRQSQVCVLGAALVFWQVFA